MNRLFTGCMAATLALCSCGGGGRPPAAAGQADTLCTPVEEPQADDTAWWEAEEEEEPIPPGLDACFEDFAYAFYADPRLQRTRTRTPLPLCTDGRDTLLSAPGEGTHTLPLGEADFYVTLSDSEADSENAPEEQPGEVTVKHLQFSPTARVTDFLFRLTDGAWQLTSVNIRTLDGEGRGESTATAAAHREAEEFLQFFHRFATDSLCRRSHIREPLAFVVPDPADDFSLLEATITLDQWFAFAPALPTEELVCIDYGRQLSRRSPTRILSVRGFCNGLCNTLTFRRRAGEWMLTRFEDASN